VTHGTFDARLLARHLGALTRAVRVHDVGNQAVSRLMVWCARDLGTLFSQEDDPRVEVDTAGVLVVNNHSIRLRRDVRVQLVPFAAMLREVGVGGFRIVAAPQPSDLRALFGAIVTLPRGTGRGAAQAALTAAGVSSFELLAPRVLISGASGGPGAAVRIAAAETLQAYIRAVLAVAQAREERNLLRIPPAVFRAAQGLADLADSDLRMHVALTSLKEDVDYDIRHPVHSMILAMALGARIGLSRPLLVELGIAAVCCASLPDEAGADEIMTATLGMLHSNRLSLARARRMLAVFEYRAGVDRTGPPYHTLESDPHLFGRICAIATSFDQLTTSGPGRSGLLADEALTQMAEETAVRFDVELLRLFATVIGRYPLGSALLFDTGEVGVVLHSPSDPALADRPLVRMVRDERGVLLGSGEIVDLADPASTRRIVSAVEPESLGIDARRALFG
jgi:hypothetical protein